MLQKKVKWDSKNVKADVLIEMSIFSDSGFQLQGIYDTNKSYQR